MIWSRRVLVPLGLFHSASLRSRDGRGARPYMSYKNGV